ncbi:MAG: hypothetical protein BHV77_16665 [Bacteroides sp. 43_108]|nr:MAG: hypothetical protein BHV77_16665 [Bacteroides sp. 43_108]
MNLPIRVYVPNLKSREDRKKSIVLQFANRSEFDLHVVCALELKNAPAALWQTFYNIVSIEKERGSDFFIFCEDDHVFTDAYEKKAFFDLLEMADHYNADILSGGMSAVCDPVLISSNLFWVSSFTGMQFTVVYSRLYDRILASKTDCGYVTDIHLSFIAKNKFVIYPYISVQKEFGYSDVTSMNNEKGRVTKLFEVAQGVLGDLYKCNKFFSLIPQKKLNDVFNIDVHEMCIPTCIINLKERKDRYNHVLNEFSGRTEFDVHIIEACKNKVGAVGLWKSICQIIEEAKESNEDCVLICEDDHIFTEYYDRTKFMRQILLASVMGAQMLIGGIGGFGNLINLRFELYWCDWFWCTQFIVVYKNAYDIILNADFGVRDVADERLSSILTNKIVIAPFISEQTDFGYSDVTLENNNTSSILRHFAKSKRRLAHYKYAERIFSEGCLPLANIDVNSYLNQCNLKALQLGCGYNLIEGWLNTDLEPTYDAVFMDVTQTFPLPDRSVDYIYMSHLLEAFAFDQVIHILKECFRVLNKNGVFRLVLFSYEEIIKLFSTSNFSSIEKEYIKCNIKKYSSSEIDLTDIDSCLSVTLTNFMHKFYNCNLYNFKSLARLLGLIGFVDIVKCDILCSKHKPLRNLESCNLYMPLNMYKFETLILEATKG